VTGRRLLVVLGNQLFAPDRLESCRDAVVFMAEDVGLCTYVKHHQQKIVLFLAAMRSYADELRAAGFEVRYLPLDAGAGAYEDRLAAVVAELDCRQLLHFEVEDKPVEARLVEFCAQRSLQRVELRSPMFLGTRQDFREFADDRQRLLMGDYYRRQRQRTGILIDADGKPDGGKWSFDAANRRKLPKGLQPPEVAPAPRTRHVDAVIGIVEQHFADHPGRASDFWWPTTREQARQWLQDFLDERLAQFGPYEDAISQRSQTVFHSVLSPSLNIGLLTPGEVLDAVLERYSAGNLPIASVEGFVRQVLGWREYIRGFYWLQMPGYQHSNFLEAKRPLPDFFWTAETDMNCLHQSIETTRRNAYAHHIQRLMIIGNFALLTSLAPAEVEEWYLLVYADAFEWVELPNTHGMALFADGGLLASKPYSASGAYINRMSDYCSGCRFNPGEKLGEDACPFNYLYWYFLISKEKLLRSNPRMGLAYRNLFNKPRSEIEAIMLQSEQFLANLDPGVVRS